MPLSMNFIWIHVFTSEKGNKKKDFAGHTD